MPRGVPESFGAVEDFKLNTCMAQNGCQDESCARSKCAYAYQVPLLR